MTPDEKARMYQDMYGCHQDSIDDHVTHRFHGDAQMAAMSILSDAQEMLHFGDTVEGKENVRQFINRAKYIMAMKMVNKSAVECKHENTTLQSGYDNRKGAIDNTFCRDCKEVIG